MDSKTIGKTGKTFEANPAGENSLFIFILCVKSVPLYHLKLAYVVLMMSENVVCHVLENQQTNSKLL